MPDAERGGVTRSSVVYVDLRKYYDGKEKHMDDGGTEQK